MVLAEFGAKITGALRVAQAALTVTDEVVHKLTNDLALALLQADVDVRLVKQVQVNLKTAWATSNSSVQGANNKKTLLQQLVVKELCRLLKPETATPPFEPQKGRSNVLLFVGLQGSGKTTSCTKLAYYYRRRGWKVALVCADTFRAGAFDQLKQNAVKAKIPFFGSYTERDPSIVAAEGVALFKRDKYDIIIVDTSGRHKQQQALFEEMREVVRVVQPDDIIFTMDASIGQAAREQAQAFKDAVPVGSLIITKLDGHARGGGALSAVAATASPIIFIGTGEHIDDFEAFNASSFVSRLLGQGDLSSLIDLIEQEQEQNSIQNKPPAAMFTKLAEGRGAEFTFRDLYELMQTMRNLGPLGKVMQMIPGMASLQSSMTKEKQGDADVRLKRCMTLMDSFTTHELDSDVQPFVQQPQRLMRIARGAGMRPAHGQELLDMFRQFKKMSTLLGNNATNNRPPSASRGASRGGGGGGGRGDKSHARAPNSVGSQEQQLNTMLQQLTGGPSGNAGMDSIQQMLGMATRAKQQPLVATAAAAAAAAGRRR